MEIYLFYSAVRRTSTTTWEDKTLLYMKAIEKKF